MTDLKGLLEVHKSNYLPDVDRMTLAQSKDLYVQSSSKLSGKWRQKASLARKSRCRTRNKFTRASGNPARRTLKTSKCERTAGKNAQGI